MTNEDKIKVLAEVDGFENIDNYTYYPNKIGPFMGREYIGGTKDKLGKSDDLLGREIIEIPDYLTDYDAIIPLVQKCLTKETCHSFFDALGLIVAPDWNDVDGTLEYTGDGSYYEQWMLFKATPEQLCDALIRALGKWKD